MSRRVYAYEVFKNSVQFTSFEVYKLKICKTNLWPQYYVASLSLTKFVYKLDENQLLLYVSVALSI